MSYIQKVVHAEHLTSLILLPIFVCNSSSYLRRESMFMRKGQMLNTLKFVTL